MCSAAVRDCYYVTSKGGGLLSEQAALQEAVIHYNIDVIQYTVSEDAQADLNLLALDSSLIRCAHGHLPHLPTSPFANTASQGCRAMLQRLSVIRRKNLGYVHDSTLLCVLPAYSGCRGCIQATLASKRRNSY